MKLYLDEDISPEDSEILRKKQMGAVSAHEIGMLEASNAFGRTDDRKIRFDLNRIYSFWEFYGRILFLMDSPNCHTNTLYIRAKPYILPGLLEHRHGIPELPAGRASDPCLHRPYSGHTSNMCSF